MTVIRPNSISGVTSITALANEINVFRHNGVLAGLQLNGVNHHTSAGVSTFHTLNVLGNVSVGGTLTYQDVTNIDSLGIVTARSGIIDETLTAGEVVFAGTGGRLNGESTLTYDGNTLQNLQSNAAANLTLKATSNSFNSLIFDSNRSADTQFAVIDGDWNGTTVNRIQFVTGSDGSNKDDGYMAFHTRLSGASLTERLRIASDGATKVCHNGGAFGVGGDPINKFGITASDNNFFGLHRSNASTGTGEFNINVETNSQVTFAMDDEGAFSFGTSTDPSAQSSYSEKLRITANGLVKTASTFGIANVGGTIGGSGGLENWIGLRDTSGNYGLIMKTASQTAGLVRNVGINETNPQQRLHVHDDNNYQGILINGNSAPRIAFARSTTTTGEWSVGIDGTNGGQFVINNSNDNSARKFIVSSSGVTASGTITSGGNATFNGDIDFTKFTPDGTITTTLSSNSASGNYTTIIPLNTSGIGHLHVYLVSIHWSFNSNGGTPYYCSGAVLWQTPHSNNNNGVNYPYEMLSSCHVGGNYYLKIRNITHGSSYPGLQAANIGWTALAGSHYIVKYKRIY